MFKMRRGEPRVKHMPMAWRSSLHEGCVAISTLQPCGLGCHMLGLHCTTCLGTNLIHNHASNEITSCPVPRPCRTGEDDSPKASCNTICYNRVCVQGLHSTGLLKHPTQELATRVATFTCQTNWKIPKTTKTKQ